MCFIIYFRQQKEEKAARLEELKKNAPSDDIFDQLPDTFESEQPELEPEETEVPTRTEFFEGDEEEEVCLCFFSDFLDFHRRPVAYLDQGGHIIPTHYY